MARRPPAPRRPGPGGAHLRPPGQKRTDAPAAPEERTDAPSSRGGAESRREEAASPGRTRVRGDGGARRGRSRTGRRSPEATEAPEPSGRRGAEGRTAPAPERRSAPAASRKTVSAPERKTAPAPAPARDASTTDGARGGVLVPAADRFRDLVRPRPWRRRRRAIIVTAAVLVLALVAAILTLLYAPYFRVQQVSVRGTSYVDAAAVEEAVASGKGTSILTLPTGDLARSAASVPGVRTAEVSRSWPHGVAVTIVEREPLATVTEAGGSTVIVDAEGVPLPDAAAQDRHLVPLQVGEGSVDDAGATHAMLDVLAALPDDLRGRVTAITATTPTDVTLAVRTDSHGDKTLVWGDAKDSELKGQVTAALLETPGTVIDVSSPVAPVTR